MSELTHAARRAVIRRAWYGPRTAEQIGAAHDMSKDGVRKIWRQEIAAGRLPKGGRPHFCNSTLPMLAPVPCSPPAIEIPAMIGQAISAPAEPAPGELIGAPGALGFDEREDAAISSADEAERYFATSASESFLDALRNAHGGDIRRRLDAVVFDDRKCEPTPAQLIAHLRKHDARMADLSKARGG